MDNEQHLLGWAIFLFGFVGLIFNKPLTKSAHAIDERVGLGLLPYSWHRILTVIGAILCMIGGLLVILNLAHIPIKK